MAEIKISGRTKVSSFYSAFLKEYPYLHAALKYPNGKPVDETASIANARSLSIGGDYTPTGQADLSIRGNLNIGTFEKRFKEAFSIECNIHLKKGGKWVATGAKYNSLTLSEASTLAKTEGFDLIKL